MFQPQPLPRTIDAALRDLQNRKTAVRRSAIADLARLVDTEDRRRAVNGLLAALRTDGDPDARAAAAIALADGGVGTSVDALVEAASDVHPRVRQMALMALGELSPKGHRAAVAAVSAALSADEPGIRFQALIAVQRLHVTGVEALLRAALGDEDEKVRYLSLRLLEEYQDQGQALDGATGLAVARCLQDEVAAVRVAAALLLAPAGVEQALDELVTALNAGVGLPTAEDEQALIEMTGELQLKAAVPGLRRHLRGRFGLVPGRFAWQARVALARLGDVAASREILQGLRSWSRDARTLAVAAAGQARLAAAREPLEELARSGRADPDALTEALGRLRRE
ncbi:MAG: hypothetical protein RJA70_1851 [Pseudomonadota bacterium]